MNFHDNRGMYDEIAKWLEENDVEVDWEAIMQCKWWVGPKDWVPPNKWSMPADFPSRLTPPIATKLLLAQWWNGLHIRPELADPLDDYVPPRTVSQKSLKLKNPQPRGGEGVNSGPAGVAATGPNVWEKILLQIGAIAKAEIIELKLIGAEDRRALVRYAWIEEELRRREVEHNRERVMRQAKGEAKLTMSRKGEEWLRQRACHGNLAAIEEMERKGYGSEEEHRKWRHHHEELVERAAKNREIIKAKKKEAKGVNGVNEEAVEMGIEESAMVMEEAGGTEEKRAGIERELEVVRVGPNPRILTCRYKELASERVCKVGVRNVANFVRGMKFRMVEPIDELEYAGVWRYEGKLPRFKGRW